MSKSSSLTYRFTLSDEEFGGAWLREYYRRPGWRVFRVAGGPALMVFGVSMILRAPDLFSRAMGAAAVLLGLWYATKPLLARRLLTRQRRESGRADAEITVTLEESGLAIEHGGVRTELEWSDVTGAGRGPAYVWYEIGRGARATIPLRVVDDVDALEALLRRKTTWS